MTGVVSFDGSCLGARVFTGVERSFLLTLRSFARMHARAVLFAPESAVDRLSLPATIDIRAIPNVPLAIWRRLLLPRELLQLRPAAHWTPTTALPPKVPCPCIATVHEIPELHAEAAEHPLRQLRQERAREHLDARAWRVVVPSKNSASDLARRHPALAGRIRVIPQPVDPRFLEHRPETSRRGFVFVGTERRRKNLARIVAAWRSLPAAIRIREPLRLIGASRHETARDVIHEPGLDTDRLITRMASARAVVLPSLSEGFGIPAIEALATGTPVLGSAGSVTADLCGDLAVLVDPYSRDDIERGLHRILSDTELGNAARARGPVIARRFHPDRTAEAWLRLLAERNVETCA